MLNDPAQPRNREKPVTFNSLEATTPEAAASLYERQYHSNPDSYHQPGVCRHCGISLGDQPEDLVMSLGAFGWAPNVCCASCAEKGKMKYAAQESADIESQFKGIIPPEFVTWDDARGNNTAKQRVIDRFNIESKTGMILFGTTGTCKTRLLYLIARLIVEWNLKNPGGRQRTFLYSDAYELATKGIPADAERVDFWLIDDLGNEPQSSKFNTALLHVIRKRYDWHRPIFISTQLTATVFKGRLFEGAAADAMLRRFRERMIPIDTDNVVGARAA